MACIKQFLLFGNTTKIIDFILIQRILLYTCQFWNAHIFCYDIILLSVTHDNYMA